MFIVKLPVSFASETISFDDILGSTIANALNVKKI